MNKILMAIAAVLVLGGGAFIILNNFGPAQYARAGGTDSIADAIIKASVNEHTALGDGSEEATAATSDNDSLLELSKAYNENDIK